MIRCRSRLLLGVAGLAAFASFGTAQAQDAGATVLQEIDVIGTTPIGGDGLDRDKVPANVTSLTNDDLRGASSSAIADGVARKTPGVSLSDQQGNPFSKDFFFRGFVASPQNGVPQGLAVYANGVRQNEAFGDTVNFDQIPEVAVDRADLFTNNPVFGLNALGGALNLTLKSGFTYQDTEMEFKAGSYGRFEGSGQWGKQVGDWAAYLAIEGQRERGFRDFSASNTKKLYGDIGYKAEAAEIHLNLTLADTHLGVVGPTPTELLERNGRGAVYTGPQTTDNSLAQLNLTGKFDVTDLWSVQSNVYYRRFKQSHVDGNDTDVEPCEAPGDPTLLCLGADDVIDPATGANPAANDPRLLVIDRRTGLPVPVSVLGGAQQGSIERTFTTSNTVGGTAQATNTGALFDRPNHFVVGASYDHGWTDFRGASELAIIPPDLQVTGLGIPYYTTFPGGILPSDVKTKNDYLGIYVTDTLDVTDQLSATVGGRLNYARIQLRDQSAISAVPAGAGIDGVHNFTRFNPMAGLTYKVTPTMTAYGSYSESNRAPTPLELGCADPAQPCQLEGFLVSDPPLKQVVTRTAELGLRGNEKPSFGGVLNWKAGVYYAVNTNDIITVPSALTGRGYFQNAGQTRRMGVELSADYQTDTWAIYGNYALVDATFRNDLRLGSPNNPNAGGLGNIRVHSGDHLPAIPEHQGKLGVEYRFTPQWTVGTDVVAMGGQYLVGDENNSNKKLHPYIAFNGHTSYQVTEQIRVFGEVNNIFNTKYSTYGTFFDNSDIPFLGLNGSRSITPAQPRSFYGGIAYKFGAEAPPVLAAK